MTEYTSRVHEELFFLANHEEAASDISGRKTRQTLRLDLRTCAPKVN
jgi:hypothetical protein